MTPDEREKNLLSATAGALSRFCAAVYEWSGDPGDAADREALARYGPDDFAPPPDNDPRNLQPGWGTGDWLHRGFPVPGMPGGFGPDVRQTWPQVEGRLYQSALDPPPAGYNGPAAGAGGAPGGGNTFLPAAESNRPVWPVAFDCGALMNQLDTCRGMLETGPTGR